MEGDNVEGWRRRKMSVWVGAAGWTGVYGETGTKEMGEGGKDEEGSD